MGQNRNPPRSASENQSWPGRSLSSSLPAGSAKGRPSAPATIRKSAGAKTKGHTAKRNTQLLAGQKSVKHRLEACATGVGPRLILTGERRNRRFKIVLDGEPVWLTRQLFETLCKLTEAALKGRCAYLACAVETIYRLRRDCGNPSRPPRGR